MSRFGDATAVRRLAEGRYEATLDEAFGIAGALNGGYLMAVLDRAAEPSWAGDPPVPEPPPFGESAGVRGGVRGGEERPPGLTDHVEMSFDPAAMGWLDGRPSGRPEIRGWFRLADPHEPDAYVLAPAVDALPPVPAAW